MTSTVLILAVCKMPVTHELSYCAPARCWENRGFDSCGKLRFRTNKNGSNYEQILLMCPVVSAYRIDVHVKKGRALLLNVRNWSLSLVSMVINDISVGREKVTTRISIPLGGPDNFTTGWGKVLLIKHATKYNLCFRASVLTRLERQSPPTENLTLYWVSYMNLF